ncbi:rhamnose utilization protein RhaD (predicted bifunctional aldolase and dehydrogenase) [Nonomuraea thailandensis]|uniref:Rhamnose utilization protein RhaD (Predicted bifunctional aldolase and dehydrogenase) n=1 Tax=Nonomuraea thailandensis TaxID=1188745 RepID=A0A9X2K2W4_9ACTN|nr:class II aldolase/adducin family protein [Nonomuraea thailandensis]MCP2358433.1 rhamnose utilization protein RhaD (predicted bifunctional aldolase and dehydrogenase) [Nonomuraea thailandensis]
MDELFTPPVDRWDPAVAGRLSGRDEVVYRSHLVGADPALTKEGGGNFSVKDVAVNRGGRTVEVLYMSAWGCDGATATPDDFPALRLADLLRLRDSGPLSESEMIGHLVDSGLRGEQRRPGIETLTHAFIPARHVDHCHPDAVIALTASPGGRQAAEDEFGEEAIWFDYRQFDVGVARELAERIAAEPRCRFVLLANHGIFTWADTSERCYRNSLEAVERATRALRKVQCRPADLGGQAVPTPPPDAAEDLLAELLPAVRGALSGTLPGAGRGDGRGVGRGVVLHLDRSPEAVGFASSVRGPGWTQAGPGCPDHLVTVGYRPLVLDRTPAGPAEVLAAIRRHRDWYDAYYDRHVAGPARAPGKRDNGPRAVVLPGLGAVTSGPDAAKARLCADHLTQTMTVIRAADAAGGYRSLSEAQGAADEYWPLMRLKPQLRAGQEPLAGVVFLVAADDERADAVAERLAAAGAHVALAAPPGRRAAAVAAAAAISGRYGERRAVALVRDTDRGAVRQAVLAYGGFDVVVAPATRMTAAASDAVVAPATRVNPAAGGNGLARAALPVFARQGRPGSILLLGEGGAEPSVCEPAGDGRSRSDGLAGGGAAVHTVVATDPEAVARAAIFLTGSGGTTWLDTTLVAASGAPETTTTTRGNP